MPIDKNYIAHPIWNELEEGFSDPVEAPPFPQKVIRFKNHNWAEKIGLSQLSDNEWVQHFAQFKPLPENLPSPLALRYHGHQFTHYNPELGDGRGFLFAQLKDLKGRTLDLATKGSGQTPYSRQGDGRLTLKGAVREALATAYLEHKGVNTSKTFSIIETGESLYRNDEPSPTRSAVLVRLSQSHIRFGTFQRLAYFKEKANMEKLRDYCIQHYYPGIETKDFFTHISQSVAKTTAEWMIHGFVHGVLNTDNINITGESFDYGPYRFLPHYDPHFTAAYFDRESLYSYGRQPQTLYWNLKQLESALHLINDNKEDYQKGYKAFQETFEEYTFKLFIKKLNLLDHADETKNQKLFHLCIELMEATQHPFEDFFYKVSKWKLNPSLRLNEIFEGPSVNDIEKLLEEFKIASLNEVQKPETLLIDEIESLWSEIDTNDNWNPFYEKLKKLEAAKT